MKFILEVLNIEYLIGFHFGYFNHIIFDKRTVNDRHEI